MAELGVLAAVLPEGADPATLARLVAAGAPPDPLLRLAALLTGDTLALAGAPAAVGGGARPAGRAAGRAGCPARHGR